MIPVRHQTVEAFQNETNITANEVPIVSHSFPAKTDKQSANDEHHYRGTP